MSDALSLVLLVVSAALHAYLANAHHNLKKSHDHHARQLDNLHNPRTPHDHSQPIPRVPHRVVVEPPSPIDISASSIVSNE